MYGHTPSVTDASKPNNYIKDDRLHSVYGLLIAGI